MKHLNRKLRYFWPRVAILYDAIIPIAVIYWGITTFDHSSKSLDEKSFLLIGLAGLILSILTGYITIFRSYLKKSRLSFSENCNWSEATQNDHTGSWFYRLRIENYGLAKAGDCVGRLIGVWDADGEQILKFDPLTLYWSRQNEFTPIDIQGYGDCDFLDVAQINGNTLKLRVVLPSGMTLTRGEDTSSSPGSDPTLKLPGTYYLRMGIYAADADISPTYFKITCSEIVEPLTSKYSPCRVQAVRKLPKIRPQVDVIIQEHSEDDAIRAALDDLVQWPNPADDRYADVEAEADAIDQAFSGGRPVSDMILEDRGEV